MTENCNSDLLPVARLNVAERQNPSHRKAICERHEWDPVYNPDGTVRHGLLVHLEMERLLREPVIAEDSDG